MSKNVLVLHGMYQSGDILRYNCAHLRHVLENYGTLHFMTASIPYQNEYSDDVDLYGWWEDDDEYTGVEKSIEHIRTAFNKYGSFDGVMGFSQGAMMLTILCALKKNNEENYKWFDPKFVINICGSNIECLRYDSLFRGHMDVPSLHVIGEHDEIKNSSIHLSNRFKNPIVKMYQSAHEIPSHISFYEDVVRFIQQHDYFYYSSHNDINVKHVEDKLEKDFFFRL